MYYNNALALAFWPPFLFLGEEYQQLSTAAATISQSRAGFVVAMSCLLGVGISFTGFGMCAVHRLRLPVQSQARVSITDLTVE